MSSARGNVKRVSYTERRSGGRTVQVCWFYPHVSWRRPELGVPCPWGELVALADRLDGLLWSSKRSIRVNEGAYKRLVVYACVRRSLADGERARELEDVVVGLDEYEAHFWYSKFVEAWEKPFGIARPAKAFKVLYGLV